MNYTSASQEITTSALRAVDSYYARLQQHRIYGRYALDMSLSDAAAPVLPEAVAYFQRLGAEIGDDTQLGCSGTPAVWAREFARLSRSLR